MNIKKTKNENPITVTIYTNSHVAINKMLEPKVRPGRSMVMNLICWNALIVNNNGYAVML